MPSKILDRWEAIIQSITERQTRSLERVAKNGVTMSDTAEFEDMLYHQNELRARIYVVKHFREVHMINSDNPALSEDAAVKLSHSQIFEALTREVVSQSTNTKLHEAYKKALLEMYRDVQHMGGL